jgi:hypothetical protein
MYGQAMARICEKLSEKGVKLSTLRALEFFARDGSWQTTVYADKVKELHAWEIEKTFEETLKANLPNAKVRIGDSFELAKEEEFAGQFDFIVIDNPQGIYGDKEQYCEHFEALECVEQLLSDKGIVIFNINHKPFDYDKHTKWPKRRAEFYGLENTSQIPLHFLKEFYKIFFRVRGLVTKFRFIENRNDEYLAYMVCYLSKVK